jgi:hypothetical protein
MATKIVVAWVDFSGVHIDPTAPNWLHGTHYTVTPIPKAHAVMWANAGTDEDVAKARAYAETDRLSSTAVAWQGVFTYPETEADPLNRGRADALAAFGASVPK